MSVAHTLPNIQEPVVETIQKIWEKQRQVFGATWPRDPEALSLRYGSLIIGEVSEAQEECNLKYHKPAKVIDRAAAAEEVADVIVFALAWLGVFCETPEEALSILQGKVAYNQVRSDWEMNAQSGE